MSLFCESGANWNCYASPSGALGSLQWSMNGLDVGNDGNYSWWTSCWPVGSRATISVVYTDPSGAVARASSDVVCLQYDQ